MFWVWFWSITKSKPIKISSFRGKTPQTTKPWKNETPFYTNTSFFFHFWLIKHAYMHIDMHTHIYKLNKYTKWQEEIVLRDEQIWSERQIIISIRVEEERTLWNEMAVFLLWLFFSVCIVGFFLSFSWRPRWNLESVTVVCVYIRIFIYFFLIFFFYNIILDDHRERWKKGKLCPNAVTPGFCFYHVLFFAFSFLLVFHLHSFYCFFSSCLSITF